MKVCVVGAGFVGLTTGVVFAEHGHTVTVVEIVPEKLESLQSGQVPFFEPGVQEAVASASLNGQLKFTSDLQSSVLESDAIFLCVGTPQGADGEIDLTYIRAASHDIGHALSQSNSNPTVVVKSTVVPGTAATVVGPELAVGAGRPIPVASNPEFLKEGTALADARNPDRIVIGSDLEGGPAKLWPLYQQMECPKLTFSTRTAEMIKYTANSFLAVKIAFANEMANVCETIGIDWQDVVEGIGHDVRINPSFFAAGLGFGGSCFPKDVAALEAVARNFGQPSGVLSAALASNITQPLRAAELLQSHLGDLKGKKIALLGLAFKANTDDVRETRAEPILRTLQRKGAEVVCHDPKAHESFLQLVPDATIARSWQDACAGADGIIVQTDWQEYKDMDSSELANMMAGNVVIDGRRALDPAKYESAGLSYFGIGLGRPRS